MGVFEIQVQSFISLKQPSETSGRPVDVILNVTFKLTLKHIFDMCFRQCILGCFSM